MTTDILSPDTLTPPRLAELGGKARSLYELGKLEGVAVPPWFAVSASAFADAVERAGIRAGLQAALDELLARGADQAAAAACYERIAPLVGKLTLTGPTAAAIRAAYHALGEGHVAVRSSALDEDGAERSFAGCLDTSLYVRGAEDICEAVLGCWRSGFTERSLAYRAIHGALSADIRVAVVVQRMVTGQVSGVLFTADPTRGSRDRALVSATWGLGEGVVSGKLACDTFVISRSGQSVIERDIAEKTHTIVKDDHTGAGTVELAVPTAKINVPCVDDAVLMALSQLGHTIEEAYGVPLDIEWTLEVDKLWILQARPITTTAKVQPVERGQRRLWDNSNIIESYDGVTTPLTYSFARRAYAMVYRQALALLGTPAHVLAENDLVFEQMIGLVRGRVYYNLESWYRTLQLLPGYRFNAEFMEQMMGVSERASFGIEKPTMSTSQRYLVELPRLVVSLAKLAGRFARVEKLVDSFYDNFDEAYGDFTSLNIDTLSLDALVSVYLEAERRIMQRWQAPIVNDILAMVFFGALRKALSSWGVTDGALHNDLLCGEGGLESTEPTRDLLRLMVDVRSDEALCALLRDNSPAEIRRRVETEPALQWLAVRIGAHVDRFGDRCIDELKLEEPTLRDDPTFLYGTLKGYLAAPPVTVEEMEARERMIRDEAERKVAARFGRNPARRRMFQFLLDGARRHVKNRENLRFARTRAFGLVRRLVIAMGERLYANGQLDDAADVFYLDINELVGFSRGTSSGTDLRGLAAVRKQEFAAYRKEPAPPERFWTDGAVYLDARAQGPLGPLEAIEQAERGSVLRGIGASPGVVRAPARLVRDPRNTTLMGEVLVANRTDPGWVPLFPSAAAVIVERGSVLSHSAIVAREFGIPCVVGLRDALGRLTDGELIEVDGNTGTVTVL